MSDTIRTYAPLIARGEVSPVRACHDRTGWVLDPADPAVPLERLGFGVFRLAQGPVTLETGDREMVVVPIEGTWRCTIGSTVMEGNREGGPFAVAPPRSNAEAVYVPRGATAQLSGGGEVAVYSAPATGDRPPAHVRPGTRTYPSRGWGPWRRFVTTLVTPEDVTTNLIFGETWSPPGGWSGTPLHQHDQNDPGAESDHEEIYFHLSPNREQGIAGCHTVQLLLFEDVLDGSWVVRDRSVFAIPGGAHPVVASPVAPAIYGWALAGDGRDLTMREVSPFEFLHDVARDLSAADPERAPLSDAEKAALLDRYQGVPRTVVEGLLADRRPEPPEPES